MLQVFDWSCHLAQNAFTCSALAIAENAQLARYELHQAMYWYWQQRVSFRPDRDQIASTMTEHFVSKVLSLEPVVRPVKGLAHIVVKEA